MSPNSIIGPSSADQPDLDWSQVRETIFMLNLAVAQICASMTDGDENIEQLSNNFIRMAGKIAEIQLFAERIQGSDESAITSSQEIIRECQEMQEFISGSVVMYQFYDRVRQRLDRVSEGLSDVAKLIANPDKLYNPQHWRDLQGAIRKNYSYDEERAVLDHLRQGCSVTEAIEKSKHTVQQNDSEEIELF